MALHDRINSIRKEKGFTIDQLAEQSNIPISTVKKICAGITTNPNLETIKAIANTLGCKLDDFDDDQNSKESLNHYEKNLIKNYQLLTNEGQRAADNMISFILHVEQAQKHKDNIIDINIRRLPLYDVPVSAGTGNFLDDSPFEIMEVGADAPMQTSYLLRASGDSMEPKIHDGDTLYIKQQDFVEDGEIGIFWYDGQVYVKKFERHGNAAYLVSLNPKYAPIKVNGDPIRCYGKVLNK